MFRPYADCESERTISTRELLERPPARPEPVEHLSVGFLESVLNASQDCIKVLTLDGELAFMNSGGQRIMEVDDFAAVRGCPWPSFWEGEHNVIALGALARAKAGANAHFIGPGRTMKGTPKWWDVTVTPIIGDDGAPTHIMSISRDITAAREMESQRELLADELLHRVKNVLAVVGAIASQTFKGGDPDQLHAFGARLALLGDAQDLLIKNPLLSASIAEVVTKAIAPHAPQDRYLVVGPAHQLDAKRVLALSLAAHELCTNATKYGAFSNDRGAVRVEWLVKGGNCAGPGPRRAARLSSRRPAWDSGRA